MKSLLLSVFFSCVTFLSHVNADEYDVTLIGPVGNVSLCQYPGVWYDNLSDKLKINVLPLGVGDTSNFSPSFQKMVDEGNRKLQNGSFSFGKIIVLFDEIWSPNQNATDFLPVNDSIKIAFGTYDSTIVPDPWIEALNTRMDALVVLDPYLIDVFKNSGLEIPIFCLPAGLVLDDYLNEPNRVTPHTPFTFGTSGPFWHRKNHELVLKAFAKEFGNSPNVRLRLHGRGMDEHVLRSLLELYDCLNLNNVEILWGTIPEMNFKDYMKSLDCYVLLSRAEGYSISPRQAMALGIPCIISNNTAHGTLCNSGFIRCVKSDIAVPDQRSYLGYTGHVYDCTLEDARAALRDVYDNYNSHLKKAITGREWVKRYQFSSLKPSLLTLLMPQQVVLGDENKIENGCLTTTSETLYQKFHHLFSFKERKKISPEEITVFNSAIDKLTGPLSEITILRNFPINQYTLCSINEYGKFYLDNIQGDIIKDRLRSGIMWESHLATLMDKFIKPNSVAVDIGAHIGTHTIHMSQAVGEQGYVIAIEPQCKIFSELIMNLPLNYCKNVIAYRCACGNETKLIQMNPTSPGNEGGTEIGTGGDFAYMIPLDDLDLENVSFIKIDAENHEDEVLEGAQKTIHNNRPVMMIEIMGNPTLDREQRVLKTIKKLKSMNYEVINVSGGDYLCIPLGK